jgi:hypothetical protein
MSVSPLLRRIVAGAASAALVAAAACTHDGTAPTSLATTQQPALSAAEAQSVGDAMAVDVGSELEGIDAFGSPLMPGMFAEASSDDAARCMPTFSPFPIVDSDSDRVPDSVKVSFSGCGFTMGQEADTVRGTIDVVDPTTKFADRDVRIRFTDFTRIEVEDRGERSFVLNGTRQATRDSSVISQSETNFKTVDTFADGDTSTHLRNWAVIFTADVKGSIHPDAPLPSGTLGVNGTSTWTHDTSTFSLMVSTNPILHYNAACAMRPKFDSGTFHATVVRHGLTSHLTVQFTACGQYTVTRS